MSINNLEKVLFELNGGWTTVVANILFGLIKWSVIAVIFMLAYRFIVQGKLF